jgi:hypothetical protein
MAPGEGSGTGRIPSGSPYRTPSWNPSRQHSRALRPFLHPHASRVGELGHRTSAVNIPRFEAERAVAGPVTGPGAHDPHQKNKGLSCCFRQTRTPWTPPSSARDRCGAARRCRCSQPTAPSAEPVPVSPGHGRHQGGKGFSPDCPSPARTAPHQWPHSPTYARQRCPWRDQPTTGRRGSGLSHVLADHDVAQLAPIGVAPLLGAAERDGSIGKPTKGVPSGRGMRRCD